MGNRIIQTRKRLKGDLPLAIFCVVLVWAAISCPMNIYPSLHSTVCGSCWQKHMNNCSQRKAISQDLKSAVILMISNIFVYVFVCACHDEKDEGFHYAVE